MVEPAEREKSELRREQIVRATLALLADAPLGQLSTRQIAREVGLSQPALFRHFSSRDEILLAVVATTRAELGQVATEILSQPKDAAAQLEALAHALLHYVAENPGLPRLLFANVASGGSPLLDAMRQLHSMQRSLIAELVRQGQREGVFDASVEPRDAATLFVGFLQALTSGRRLEPGKEPLQVEGRRLLSLWLRAVRASTPQPAPVARPPAPKNDGLRHVDARALLARGIDPLDSVLEAVEEVGPCGVVVLTVPFRPTPLLTLLSSRGHALKVAEISPRHWTVEIIHGGRPEPEDLRELEAPEPLERVLLACAALPAGGVYLARLPRNPRLLYPRLRERGLEFSVHDEPDGTALLRVFKPT